jgi:nucleoid-associated protein YgaU
MRRFSVSRIGVPRASCLLALGAVCTTIAVSTSAQASSIRPEREFSVITLNSQHRNGQHVRTQVTARASRMYTVRSGDTLSGISGREYGSASCWPGIYRANSSRISNPNLIYPRQQLQIPSGCAASGCDCDRDSR